MSRPAIRLGVLCLAFVLLAACGGDDGATSSATDVAVTATPPTEPSTTGPSTTEPSSTEVPSSTAPATTTAPTAAGPCPAGTWRLTTEALQSFYDLVGEQTGVTFVVQGGALLVLTEEGTFEYQFQDYRLSQSVGGSTTDVTIAGTIGGTYTTDGTRFTTTITNPDVTASAVVDGTPIEATAILQGILAEFPLSNATFACEGSELVVDFRVLDGTTPIRMVPA
jgi:hypothetical protein